jgi:hypothetical protein
MQGRRFLGKHLLKSSKLAVNDEVEKSVSFLRGTEDCVSKKIAPKQTFKRGFFRILSYFTQHCFICNPSDSTVSQYTVMC